MAAKRRGANEGSIFQRKDGRWVAQMDLGIRDGRRRFKSVYGTSRREVAEALTKLLRERDTGTLPTAGRETVGEYLTTWLRDARGSLRPSTARSYQWLIEHHLVRELGAIRLEKLTPADVRAMYPRLAKAGLSPQSVHHARAVLRTALAQAVRDGLIARNAATLAVPPRVEGKEATSLTPAEVRTFLDSLAGDRMEPLYRVVLALGLRQGEALGLRWEDVDLDARRLRVAYALQRVGGKPTLVEPKTDRSRRTVTLPNVVVDALRARRAAQLEERLLAGAKWRETGLVFTTTVGTPMHGPDVTKGFQAALARAGVRRVRFHDMRHTAASFLLAEGVPARVVMELLGHSTIVITMNLYSHVMPSLLDDAAAAMDRGPVGR